MILPHQLLERDSSVVGSSKKEKAWMQNRRNRKVGVETSKISVYFQGFILNDWLMAINQRFCVHLLSWQEPLIEVGLGNPCRRDTCYTRGNPKVLYLERQNGDTEASLRG